MKLERVICSLLVVAACEREPEPTTSSPREAPATKEPAKAEVKAEAKAESKADAEPTAASKAEAKTETETPGLALTFDDDAVGGPAAGIEAVVGDWVVAEEDGARGLLVDGSRWRSGTPSANIVDQARRLYGDRYAEFLDGVKAFAFFPLAVVEEAPPEGDLRLSVRFFPIAGKIDQAAGIAFGIQPDGSYACIRANALEDNILWATVTRGRRKIIDTIRDTPTPTRTWHTLVVLLRGTELEVELDGKQWFRKTLDARPTGRVGLWSKADSQVLFDDFRVEPLGE
jgi:hypothetical protein